ncbi:MAG TPA: hypothetical protein VNH20_05065 [Candidatus Dormibacteraeota bacterium]|nr:hypothetical protein [Candidatus Dormibacteraeota bacterium]
MDDSQRSERSSDLGDESHLSPEESLALIEAQREKAARSLYVAPALILAVWGVAWLVGFGALYLTSHRGLGVALPAPLVTSVFLLLFAVAAVVSFGEQVRRGRGVSGPSRRSAALYGWSWLLAFVGLIALDLALENEGLPPRLATLLWPGSSLLVVGLLYLAGGMLWEDRRQYWLGVWVLITGAASVAAGVPGNFAVLSLAGGGGFLIGAAVALAGDRRPQPARP